MAAGAGSGERRAQQQKQQVQQPGKQGAAGEEEEGEWDEMEEWGEGEWDEDEGEWEEGEEEAEEAEGEAEGVGRRIPADATSVPYAEVRGSGASLPSIGPSAFVAGQRFWACARSACCVAHYWVMQHESPHLLKT
jgi:hypothetical protein